MWIILKWRILHSAFGTLRTHWCKYFCAFTKVRVWMREFYLSIFTLWYFLSIWLPPLRCAWSLRGGWRRCSNNSFSRGAGLFMCSLSMCNFNMPMLKLLVDPALCDILEMLFFLRLALILFPAAMLLDLQAHSRVRVQHTNITVSTCLALVTERYITLFYRIDYIKESKKKKPPVKWEPALIIYLRGS